MAIYYSIPAWAIHSSIFAWVIPWTEEPSFSELDTNTLTHTHTHTLTDAK